MKELKQLNLHRPEEGLIGDCFRTCIACLLDMPAPDHVPHAYELAGWDNENSTEAHKLLNEYLKTFNLRYVEYPVQATEETLQVYLYHYYKDMYVHVG